MKIIDVLNKIADGTLEDGFEFMYRGDIFIYDKGSNILMYKEALSKELLYAELGEMYTMERILNNEIEVIENPKKIEKLEAKTIYNGGNFNEIATEIESTKLKLNEVIDKLNELLEEK